MSSKITCNPSIVSHTSHICQRLSFLWWRSKVPPGHTAMWSWHPGSRRRCSPRPSPGRGRRARTLQGCSPSESESVKYKMHSAKLFLASFGRSCADMSTILTFCKCWSGVSSAASVRASTISKEEDMEDCNVALAEKKHACINFVEIFSTSWRET